MAITVAYFPEPRLSLLATAPELLNVQMFKSHMTPTEDLFLRFAPNVVDYRSLEDLMVARLFDL